MKIYHPKLDVTEDVNEGLAGVLIRDGGWQKVEDEPKLRTKKVPKEDDD